MLNSNDAETLRQIATAWPIQRPGSSVCRSGWFSKQHAGVFKTILQHRAAGLYLELGTWTGVGSTEFVVKQFPQMSLVCIDTFAGSKEHQKDPKQKEIAANLWNLFCVNRWADRERIYPIKAQSVDGLMRVAAAGLNPDFIYIDAAHEADAVFADVSAALTLFPKAVILGDDYVRPGAGHPGVYNGIDRAVKQKLINPAEFKHVGRVWYLTRNLS